MIGAVTATQDLIRRSYTAAADHFDDLPFWHRFGRRTVDSLHLRPGERVLDLCCGTGASALPAAEAVGPEGAVLGVDLTAALISRARVQAARRGLTQAQFTVADVAALTFPDASFDAVISVFGLFFIDDRAELLRRAWTWLAPGGRLATTVWGATVLDPGEAWFWDEVRKEDASLDHISPAGALASAEALRQVHEDAGLPVPEVRVERWRMPLSSADAFWPVIMGTSNRGVFDALTPDAQLRVRAATLARLHEAHVDGLECEALIATMEKSVPAGSDPLRRT